MHAKLFCKTGQLAGARYRINDEATIGKGVDNSIRLDAGPVSTKHARIYFDKKANAYIIEDLGSRNGTRLDGARVREKERLGPLHIITFAETYDFIFQVIQEEELPGTLQEKPSAPARVVIPAPPTTAEKTELPPPKTVPAAPAPQKTTAGDKAKEVPPLQTASLPARQHQDDAGKNTVIDDAFGAVPPPEVTGQQKQELPQGAEKTIVDDGAIAVPSLPLQDRTQSGKSTPANVRPPMEQQPPQESTFVLEFYTLKGGKTTVELHGGENTVGRASTCDVAIDDNSMSRNHAVITVRAGRVTLKDLGSKNYTFVNRKRITEEIEILPDAEVVFGVVQSILKRKT